MAALEPFARVFATVENIPTLDMNTPLNGKLPHAWPTYKDAAVALSAYRLAMEVFPRKGDKALKDRCENRG